MSRTLTSSHFKVENLEFDGSIGNYGGIAVINGYYMTFGISAKYKIELLLHDPRHYPSDRCQLCQHEDRSIHKLARTYQDELFQLLIHHPSVRLHWMMINPSDYEERT